MSPFQGYDLNVYSHFLQQYHPFRIIYEFKNFAAKLLNTPASGLYTCDKIKQLTGLFTLTMSNPPLLRRYITLLLKHPGKIPGVVIATIHSNGCNAVDRILQ